MLKLKMFPAQERPQEIDGELRSSFPRSALMFGERELLATDVSGGCLPASQFVNERSCGQCR